MPRLFVLALLVVVALDFSTPDAVLSVAGGRSMQWDDEEDSVLARRQGASREERRVAAFPVVPRSIERDRPQASAERRARVDRLNDQMTGQLPFRQTPDAVRPLRFTNRRPLALVAPPLFRGNRRP